jgi:prepilin peptidase CpaA
VVPDVLLVGLCAVAAITDLRRRLIYNWLTFPAILAGILLGVTMHGWLGLLSALGGGLVGLIVFGFPAALGWIKLGDLKLVVACGVLTRFPLVLWGLAYTCLAGGALGIGCAIYAGRLGSVLANLGRAAVGTFRRGDQPRLKDLSQLTVPYGVAIALGFVWTALTQYLPRVALF